MILIIFCMVEEQYETTIVYMYVCSKFNNNVMISLNVVVVGLNERLLSFTCSSSSVVVSCCSCQVKNCCERNVQKRTFG
jgi:hypothetical protein